MIKRLTSGTVLNKSKVRIESVGNVELPKARKLVCLGAAAKVLASAVAPVALLMGDSAIAVDRGWELEPYRIRVIVAVDAPGRLTKQLDAELPETIERRVAASIGPAWNSSVQLAERNLRHAVLSRIAQIESESEFDLGDASHDKLLLASVRWTPIGYELAAREYDRFVEQWSPVLRRTCRQTEMLTEQLFALIWQTVGPLARLELDPEDNQRVTLIPRAAALLKAWGDDAQVRPGDIFLPVLRRTTRDGSLAEGGVQAVPWTYVAAVDVKNEIIAGRLYSGNRNPLGVRRQGRVEQVAIGLRADPAPTTLQFVSRSNPDKRLVGYEVYAQDANSEATERIGTSDAAGNFVVSPSAERVQFLTIKNGAQLLARFPVVPGAEAALTVPLPDDDARLAAESRLAALREDLIDVVARRNILMVRARQKMEQDDLAAAQELLRTIDELPGRPQFNLALATAARQFRSDDPQIQRRIDQLIEATQTVMAQYLDTGPISELNEAFRAAQRK